MAGSDLLARLDAILAELEALRAELAAADARQVHLPKDGDDLSVSSAAVGNGRDEVADDISLIDTHAAQERFGYPRDTIAKWCREGCGVKRGGRWLVDPVRLWRRLNGG
jgi:hypothetical protein